MSHPFYHALSSAKRFGGSTDDYIAIHNWLDASKAFIAGPQHRALRHHAEGIFECEEKFGVTITNSQGKQVPVRLVAEQHVVEDLGRIPTLADWFSQIPLQPWMLKPQRLSVMKLDVNEETPVCPVPDQSPTPIGTEGV